MREVMRCLSPQHPCTEVDLLKAASSIAESILEERSFSPDV